MEKPTGMQSDAPRHRVAVTAVFAALVVALSAAPGTTGPSAGGVSSDNVTYLGTVPTEAGAAATGARLVDEYLYVGGARSFSIYDVSDPESPALVSITPTGPQFPNEDIDTNGSILLVSNELRRILQVWDVEDKSAPVKLAEMSNLGDHTFTCVFDCRYAYGSRGAIIDLKDPSAPVFAGGWGVPPRGDGYDTTEVSPGLVLTATRTINLLDVRKKPTRPETIARGTTPDDRLIHSLRWPNGGRDRFFLVQGETPFSRFCEEDSGAFMTWDTRGYKKTRTFHMVDEYRVVNGTMVDGNPPANGAGCTAMWFQEHPRFSNGGLVASAFFEHGVRFLDVGPKGSISEVGYFTPLGGEAIASYWITDEIVYSVDMTRGIDILRFDG